jgi:hypothetical protein
VQPSAARVSSRAAVVALAVCCLVVPVAGSARAANPERLLVSGDEWNLVLSRAQIAPGRAEIQFLNRGEDDHDLRLRRITRRPAAPIARWPETRPGELSERPLRLSTGRYRLWCSLPGHRKLGMRATLRVSRKRSRD